MVPTRWSITATDDTISKEHLKKIRYFQHLNQITLYSGNYLGNYIEALLLPGNFTFEAIESWQQGSTYSADEPSNKNLSPRVCPNQIESNCEGTSEASYPLPPQKFSISADYENFNGRKTYASNVTGGYYAMRLPLTEHLLKIQRQASVLMFREIRPEYYAPLGVGIVRETAKRTFQSKPKHFDTIPEALQDISTRIQTPINTIKEKSWLLDNYGKQKTLLDFH